ncbi:MAG TPA: VOC family protein [Stellaceae bacterium]|nr:VOC family protein [Stellaceae bacterium]
MSEMPKFTMSHVGIVVKDLPRMERFYRDVLGFAVTDRGVARGQPMVFLSREAHEHHQIVLQEKRLSDETTINQISFRVANLEDLRCIHRRLKDAAVKEINLVDHCLAWSVYCHDPEGNRLEFFVDGPYYVHQPIVEPLALERSDEEIRRATEARFVGNPSFATFDAWKSDFRRKLQDG